MVTDPVVSPDISPVDGETDTMDGSVLLHVPPGVTSESIAELPVQIVDVPEMEESTADTETGARA